MLKREEMPYRQSTLGIVTNNDGEFLVVKKSSYSDIEWSFPGGGVEDGESPETAVARELEEELLTNNFKIVGKGTQINVYDWPEDVIEVNYNKRGQYFRGQEMAQFFVLFEGRSEDINPGDGLMEVRWVTRESLKSYLIFPNQFDNAEKIINEFIK